MELALRPSTPERRYVLRPSRGYIAARYRIDRLIRLNFDRERLEQAIAKLVHLDEPERSALRLYAWGSCGASRGS